MRDVLTTFVDRTSELGRFCDMLGSEEKPIMMVWGEDGIGKSSFLARVIHECSTRRLNKAEVFSTKDRFNTYLKIMRKIRDDVGAEFFPDFTRLVNFFFPDPTQPAPAPTVNINVSGAQSVLDRARLEGVNVSGDIAGVIVKDLMINVPRPDMDLKPSDRMVYLTDAFIQNLAPTVKDKLLVIFFDDIQEWAEETYQWLWNELVGALRSGRLSNLRLVLCCRTKPVLTGDAGMIVKEAALKPLELPDIERYLEQSGVEPEETRVIAKMLLATSKGIPLAVATALDAYFECFPEKRMSRNG
jgi:hypothetical protein